MHVCLLMVHLNEPLACVQSQNRIASDECNEHNGRL